MEALVTLAASDKQCYILREVSRKDPDVSNVSAKSKRNSKIIYTLKPHMAGRGVFSDVEMPDGTIIRRVDQSVHEQALKAASKAYKEKYGQ